MGFFKDFKRDFAQAVNELMPDKDELANEYDDEDMVNTFDENDNMDIAPEDMLENLDDFTIDNIQPEENHDIEPDNGTENSETEYQEEPYGQENNVFDTVPEAEIISDHSDSDIDDFDDNRTLAHEMVSDLLVSDNQDKIKDKEADEQNHEGSSPDEDELVKLDELDEDNMLENADEALAVEPEQAQMAVVIDSGLKNVDLDKAVEDAIMRHGDEPDNESGRHGETENLNDIEEENMAEIAEKSAEAESILKDKDQDINSVLSDDTTYITKGTTIKGNIETEGGVDIIGVVEGDVSCGGKLIIGGTIKGNVTAGEVYANAAKVEGEIITEGSVKIGVGSVVVGNVTAGSAVVAGAVNGDIDVQGPVIVDSTAVIMGNIKSRSVQINNGAVIEGFCSQCYSEIDVKSFFD